MSLRPAPSGTLFLPPSVFNDSMTSADDCDATHAFHFDCLVPSNVLSLSQARLSLFLRAYRGYASSVSISGVTVASALNLTGQNGYTGFSAPTDSAVSSVTTNHVCKSGCDGQCHAGSPTVVTVVTNLTLTNNVGAYFGGTLPTFSNTTAGGSVSMNYGVALSTVAAGVTVVINGVDRTAALGGPFSTDQVELNVLPYLTVGILNTIALTPTGLGHILACLRLTGKASPQ